jgi:hypothetical protein
MDKPSKPEASSGAPDANKLLHCGFVTDLKMGIAEDNVGAGLLMEFLPALNLPNMAMILAPHMAVELRKSLERMERQFGWTEKTTPPNMKTAG